MQPPPRLDLSAGIPPNFLRHLSAHLNGGGSIVVTTSGSTGYPRPVVLTSEALLASARASHEMLGGPGQWLSALSPAGVGGLQVFIRSFVSGLHPALMPAQTRFSAEAFVAVTATMRSDQRRYVSLVPTQIHRLLATEPGADALASFDRVLIGGAPLTPSMTGQLHSTGVSWTHTYGMTETSGGCVYDGIPLRGVRLRCEGPPGEPGRLMIAGPMLAQEYADEPDLTAEAFVADQGQRWFKTGDIGIQDPPGRANSVGRWRVLGRIDDVINTGGHKVHPQSVVDALTGLPEVTDAAVLGVADAEWGTRVAGMVVLDSTYETTSSQRADPTGWLRLALRPQLSAYSLPAQIVVVKDLPRLPSGKVDMGRVRAAFIQEDDRI